MAFKLSLKHVSSVGLMGLSALALMACATPANNPNPRSDIQAAQSNSSAESADYNESELVTAISTHLGVTSESAASAIARLFRERGRPVGYITGEEGGGALTIGARYGKGTLWMKNGETRKVYWQGPTIGFDAGAEAGKVFTLVYGLRDVDDLYRRLIIKKQTASPWPPSGRVWDYA